MGTPLPGMMMSQHHGMQWPCRLAGRAESDFRAEYASKHALPSRPKREPPLAALQHTLASAFSFKGVGLHEGRVATVRVMPAPAGYGRRFVRDGSEITGTLGNVVGTALSVELSEALHDGAAAVSVRTVEHLLSALVGLQVDNARIEIEGGSEIPLMDGSSAPFVNMIRSAGGTVVAPNFYPRSRLCLLRPVTVAADDAWIAAFPLGHGAQTRITYGINFSELPSIGEQWVSWEPSTERYGIDIAHARTFGIAEQVDHLRSLGLIRGGTLDNALLCSKHTGWVNPPLRYVPDEPCRHKVLDLVGDLGLLGGGLANGLGGLPHAHIVAYKASHKLHIQLAKGLADALAEGTAALITERDEAV